MPTALTNIETLLPLDKLQQVVQHYGCPSFHYVDGSLTGWGTYEGVPFNIESTANSRYWYVHFFTGRVPTPAEFYYGVYFDRIGDTHTTKALALSERTIGYFLAGSAAYPSISKASSALVGATLIANGARWPSGAAFVASTVNVELYNGYSSDVVPPRCLESPLATSEWALDWSFSPANTMTLRGGDRPSLRNYAGAGHLPQGGRPTWFWLSSSASLPSTATLRNVDYSKVDNAYRARIEQLRNVDGMPEGLAQAELEKRPILLGTVGAAGSGADLELAVGYSPVPDVIRPLALRARLVAAPTAG